MKYGENTPFYGWYKQQNFSTLAEFFELVPKCEHRCQYCRGLFEEGQEFYCSSRWGDEYYYHKDCYRDLMRQYSS